MAAKTTRFLTVSGGGQFAAQTGGQFAAQRGGQFKTQGGGQFQRFFQYWLHITAARDADEAFSDFHKAGF